MPSTRPTRFALRKRLWQVGFALALFIATAAAMNFFQPGDRAVSRKSAGHDFLAFYTAGTFVRTGRADRLYDLAAVKGFEREVIAREGLELAGNDDFGPYWNPPLFAWVFAPLSRLSYHTAWNVWLGVNLLCFVIAAVVLKRILADDSDVVLRGPQRELGGIADPERRERAALIGAAPAPIDWRTWGLVPLLMAVSMPFIQALGHGQNTCLSLLLLSATAALWRRGRGVAAGMVAGLLFYKPQLAAVIAAALILTLGWRAIAGLAITGAAMIGATVLTLPGTLTEFIHRLPDNVIYMQVEHRYLWERHVTLKAFWRLLLQGYAIGDLTPLTRTLYLSSAAVLASLVFVTVWKLRHQSDPLSRDRLIAATIVAMPLLMPFYFDYDLLLLTAAAVLVAREHLYGDGRIDWPVLGGWAALYAWLIFNPAVAGRTHVNGTVLILSFLAAALVARAMRQSAVRPAIMGELHALRPAA